MMTKKIPPNRLLIIALIAAFLLLAGSREFIAYLADWLFFREVGYSAVFTKTFLAKLLTGLAFGATAFLMLFINLGLARRRTFPLAGLNPLWEQVPQLQRLDLNRLVEWISFAVALVAFVLAFPIGAQYWEQALLFLNSRPAGLVDPLFGKDISFFLFQYPFIDAVNTLVRGLIVISALLTAAGLSSSGAASCSWESSSR